MKEMIEDLSKPSDPTLASGEARCPGRSVEELLSGEDSANGPGLMANSYQFLGDQDLPFARYTVRNSTSRR